MERKRVSSSTIVSVGYDKATNILEIEFKSGGTYRYSGVPESVYRSLVSDSSPGTYHARNIKNVFPFIKI